MHYDKQLEVHFSAFSRVFIFGERSDGRKAYVAYVCNILGPLEAAKKRETAMLSATRFD